MILQKQHSRSLALLVFAIGATASAAHAQSVYRAKVDLPVQLRWGSALLHPGSHEIMLENGPVPVIQISGQGDFARILAGPVDYNLRSERSTIQFVNTGDGFAVKRFNVGVIGRSFDFHVRKAKGNNTEAAAESGTTVAVSDNP